MYPEETKKYGIKKIKECGKKISFTPQKCETIHPLKWKDIEEVYFIVVDSPQLDKIRKKYKLPKRELVCYLRFSIANIYYKGGSNWRDERLAKRLCFLYSLFKPSYVNMGRY